MDLAPEVVELIRRTADGFPWGPARRRYFQARNEAKQALLERYPGLLPEILASVS